MLYMVSICCIVPIHKLKNQNTKPVNNASNVKNQFSIKKNILIFINKSVSVKYFEEIWGKIGKSICRKLKSV